MAAPQNRDDVQRVTETAVNIAEANRRPFIDWFVKYEEEWRIRLAVDLPASRS